MLISTGAQVLQPFMGAVLKSEDIIIMPIKLRTAIAVTIVFRS